jgi:hypothetical protein
MKGIYLEGNTMRVSVAYLTEDERLLANDPHQRERALWERLSAVG